MKIFIIYLALVVSLLLSSCDNSTEVNLVNYYYFTSFENESDLKNWVGISLEGLQKEAPEGYGQKSAFISGGCLVPHAYIIFEPPGRDLHVSLCCYGKTSTRGGGLSIGTNKQILSECFIQVQDSNWTFYESTDELFWPTDSTLMLSMSSGGFAPSSMLIDGLGLIIKN